MSTPEGFDSIQDAIDGTGIEVVIDEKVPEPGSGGMVHFPTPAGTRWSDIKIQFRDGFTVTAWAGGESGRYNYT